MSWAILQQRWPILRTDTSVNCAILKINRATGIWAILRDSDPEITSLVDWTILQDDKVGELGDFESQPTIGELGNSERQHNNPEMRILNSEKQLGDSENRFLCELANSENQHSNEQS